MLVPLISNSLVLFSARRMAKLASALKEKWAMIVFAMRRTVPCPMLAPVEMEHARIPCVIARMALWVVTAVLNALPQGTAQVMVLAIEMERALVKRDSVEATVGSKISRRTAQIQATLSPASLVSPVSMISSGMGLMQLMVKGLYLRCLLCVCPQRVECGHTHHNEPK